MAKQYKDNIKILFVCHGNMLRGIPLGLNTYENEKCKKCTEKS